MKTQRFLLHKYLKYLCIYSINIFILISFPISIMAMDQINGGWKLSGDSEIGRILALAPENSWVKLNTNRFDEVWTPFEQRPRPPEAPSAGHPRDILIAWSSMAWDSNRGSIIIWGGGHANYAGNEPYIWNSSTLSWTRAALPSEIQLVSNIVNLYEVVDGNHNAPVAAHTYDNSDFFPILDRYVTFGGASFNTGTIFKQVDGSLTGPYFFNPGLADENAVGGTTGSNVKPNLFPNVIGNQMWSNRDNMTPVTPGEPRPGRGISVINGVSAYANEEGVDVLYVQAGGNLVRYAAPSLSNPTLDNYEEVGNTIDPFFGQGAGAFDPHRRIFVRTASGSGGIFTFWDLSQTDIVAQNVIFTPDVVGGTFNFGQLAAYGLDFDNIRQVYVLWDGNHDIWHLTPPEDLISGTWTLSRVVPQGSNGPQNTSNPNGILGKWKYAHALDAFIGLFDPASGDIWAYKPANWQPIVEAASDFIATPMEGQTIFSNETPEIKAFSFGNTPSSIEFFVNGETIGTSDTAPHSITWSERTPGTHSLTVVVTHADGTSSQSAPVNVVASPNSIETLILRNGLNDYMGTTDSYLYEFHNNSNFGELTILREKANGSANLSSFASLVRFAVFQSEGGPIPDGAVIQSASLSLYKSSPYDHVYRMHRVLSNWTEDGVTWDFREPGLLWSEPGAKDFGVDIADIADGESSVLFTPGLMTVDVTSGMQEMAASSLNYGWKLVSVSGNANRKEFFSSEYDTDLTLRPTLEIKYVSNTGTTNIPPTIQLTAPLADSQYEVGTSILLTATADDIDDSVTKVAFYANGNLLGEDTETPYEFTWQNASVGAHTIQAIVTDSRAKQTSSSEANIVVNNSGSGNLAPTVSLTGPTANSEHVTGAPITLTATAEDTDGVITKVAFFANGSLLGEATEAPYQFTWQGAVSGTHTLQAIATDDQAETVSSTTVQVLVSMSTTGGSIETIILRNGLNDYTGTTDSYLYEFHNNSNFGELTILREKANGSANLSSFASLVRFAIFQSEGGPIPDGTVIQSASLSLYKSSPYDHVYRMHRVLSNWTEDGVTWDYREPGLLWSEPGANSFGVDIAEIADGESSVLFTPGLMTIDVTSGVQEMAASSLNYGWKLVSVSGNANRKEFFSSEYDIDPILRPILEIKYVPNTGTTNIPPTIQLTAPLADSQYEVGTSILLTATADDIDDSVTKVAFYANGNLLGEDTETPYEFTWQNASVGAHTIQAIVTDSRAKQTSSNEANIVVNNSGSGNLAPTVSLTEPIANSQYVIGAPITLTAAAEDMDGVIAKVAFFANGSLLGEATEAPYQFTWQGAISGTHTLQAIATDDQDKTASSTTVQVLVSMIASGNFTNVELQEGLNGYTGTTDSYLYKFHNLLNFGDVALLRDGSTFTSLIRFAIFQSEGGPVPDGATIQKAELSLYKSSLYDHVYGVHRIISNWTEEDVTWDQRLPGLLWSSPGANAFGIDIAETADGEASTLFTPGLMTVDLTSGVQAMSAGAENYGWKLVPISGNGNRKEFLSSEHSEELTLRPKLEIEYLTDPTTTNLPPTVELTAPVPGTQHEVGKPLLLAATADDTDGFVTKVDFYANGNLLGEATEVPHEFIWSNAPEGTHTLQAVVTDDGGKQTTSLVVTITATVPGAENLPPTVMLTEPMEGTKYEIGELILLEATANDSDGSVAKVAFFANGNLLGEVTEAPYTYTWPDALEGMHTLNAVATDDKGLIGNSELFEITVNQIIIDNNHRVTLQEGLGGYNGTKDSHVYRFHNFVNFGGNSILIDSSSVPNTFGTFIQFAIFESEGGPVPDQAIITSAILRLYKSSFYDHVYRAHPFLSIWLEDQVTWEESQLGVFWNEPSGIGLGSDIDTEFDGEAAVSWEPNWLRIDVTRGVQAIKTGRANYGWRLVPVSGNKNTKRFISSEYIEDVILRPALEIEYLLQ